jgi:hypothetical protein
MRLIRLALALAAVSVSWAAMANPAINSNVSGAIAGTVGASVVNTTAATQMVSGQTQARLDGGLGTNLARHDNRAHSGTSSAAGMDDSMPRGWLMVLVAVLLIGHQLRRKHRFLRPQRFSDL